MAALSAPQFILESNKKKSESILVVFKPYILEIFKHTQK